MAKDFSKSDAKLLIEKHDKNIDFLKQVIELDNVYKRNISNSIENYIQQEVIKVLSGVPVEEINNIRKGIRVKALRDDGINTMGDIYKVKPQRLERIKGISEEGSVIIKSIANEFALKTLDTIRVKLNADKKDKYSSTLVKWVASYKNSKALIVEAREIYNNNTRRIKELEGDLSYALGSMKWLFAGKDKKEKAINAYKELESLINSEYDKNIKELVNNANSVYKMKEDEAWHEFSKEAISFYNVIEEVNFGISDSSGEVYGLPEELGTEVVNVELNLEGLKCTLRRYQELGVKYIIKQERVLLGDEMGLGKTVQAIASMVHLRNTGSRRFVVVSPASVHTNWYREIIKHSNLNAIRCHGSNKEKALDTWMRHGGVLVTTYESLQGINIPDDYVFAMLVVDEAHYIKNPEARRSQNVRELCKKSSRVLFMTGTAIENRVEEMINLVRLLKPSVAKTIRNVAFMSSAPQFRENIAPVYYRRKRDDVLTELPELIESQEWCTLLKGERHSYEEAVLSKKFHLARRMSWNIDDLADSSKARRLIELLDEAKEDDRKVIVFSFFLDTISKLKDYLGDRAIDVINGSVSVERRQEIIDEFDKSEGGKVLLAQIQSAGTGLNIQSASVVIFCEPQFKPSIENQAISRAYRMGQSRNVLVYRLLCEDTIDERLMDVLEQKQKIFDAFADKSVAASEVEAVEISDGIFEEIMEEEIQKIKEKRENPVEETE